MSACAILNDKRELIKVSYIEWASWLEKNQDTRIVKQEEVEGKYVSTVFMGLDHSFGFGPPLWFETMVFKGKKDYTDIYQRRYSTWEQAEQGHKEAVEWVRTEAIKNTQNPTRKY